MSAIYDAHRLLVQASRLRQSPSYPKPLSTVSTNSPPALGNPQFSETLPVVHLRLSVTINTSHANT